MSVPSASTMRAELKQRLIEMVNARDAFNQNIAELKRIGIAPRTDRLFLSEATERAISFYFEKLCSRLTTEHANGTPAEVKLAYSLYGFDRSSYDDQECGLNEPFYHKLIDAGDEPTECQIDLMEEAVGRIDFDAIEQSLTGQVNGLANEGLRLIAENYMHAMNIYYSHASMKITGRHVVLQMDSCDNFSSYQWRQELQHVLQLHGQVQQMGGVCLGNSIHELDMAVCRLSFENPTIPSRTAFGKGTDLEIVCFKDKYEFRYSRKAFDAILAFISLFGKGERFASLLNETASLTLPLAS